MCFGKSGGFCDDEIGLLFAIACNTCGRDEAEGGGLLIAGVVGGAFFTLCKRKYGDNASLLMGFENLHRFWSKKCDHNNENDGKDAHAKECEEVTELGACGDEHGEKGRAEDECGAKVGLLEYETYGDEQEEEWDEEA